MWLRRLAALVVAVALVAGTFAIRDHRRTSAGASGPGGSTPANGAFTLVCATELAALCTTLGSGVTVRVEPVATTAGTLRDATSPRDVADAWLTVDPWPALSDLDRTRGGAKPPAFTAASSALGHSPVGVAVRKLRAAVLAIACQGAVTLTCVGENGRRPWVDLGGRSEWQLFKPTFSNPSGTATGPAALAAAVRQRRGDRDLDRTSLEADGEFANWLSAFLKPPAPGTSSLVEAITRLAYDAVILPQAEFTATTGAEVQFDFLPASASDAQLVLAPVGDARVPDAVRNALETGVRSSGWSPGASTSTPVPANLVAGFVEIWKEGA